VSPKLAGALGCAALLVLMLLILAAIFYTAKAGW
jgi:hypothetical protein